MKTKFKWILGLLILITAVSTGFAKEAPKETMCTAAGVAIVDQEVLNTLNEKFIITKFRHIGTWLQEITSRDNWVNNDVIKIPKRKGDSAPLVLINNNVFPIQSSNRADEMVTV